jgi:hypothetical protein
MNFGNKEIDGGCLDVERQLHSLRVFFGMSARVNSSFDRRTARPIRAIEPHTHASARVFGIKTPKYDFAAIRWGVWKTPKCRGNLFQMTDS